MKTDLEPLCIAEHATLRQAMTAIEAGVSEIALVTNGDRRLLGVLTDGDIRRALLDGADLGSSASRVMVREYSWVRERSSRAEVLDLMRARRISQIPALDEDGRLAGLHLLHDFLARVHRNNWALVMAAGRGTQLHSLTETTPRPMSRVAGRPILERTVLHLVGAGIKEVFISVNHLRDEIEDHFRDGSDFGCSIHYLREEHGPRGDGPLALLPRRPEAPVLVMNGDLVVQLDVGAVLDFHAVHRCGATMAVKAHNVDVPFAVADVDGDRLIGLQEKPRLFQLVDVGIYVLSPETLDLVPAHQPFSITDLFRACLASDVTVGSFRIDED